MLDDFTQEQLTALPSLAPDTFLYIMEACEQGVESSENYIRSHACAAIDNICKFVVRESQKSERPFFGGNAAGSSNGSPNSPPGRRRSSSSKQAPATHWLMAYLQQFSNILPTLFVTVFNLVLFDDNQDQWTLSRPLYSLTLLQREASAGAKYGYKL